jgi:hypothetical protein
LEWPLIIEGRRAKSGNISVAGLLIGHLSVCFFDCLLYNEHINQPPEKKMKTLTVKVQSIKFTTTTFATLRDMVYPKGVTIAQRSAKRGDGTCAWGNEYSFPTASDPKWESSKAICMSFIKAIKYMHGYDEIVLVGKYNETKTF